MRNFARKNSKNTPFFMHHNDTICAPATAAGGAIAIIRISGPHAISAADAVFSRPIADAAGYTLHYGTIAAPAVATSSASAADDATSSVISAAADAPLDDALLSVFRAPHSYTGEDCVEISVHGSPYIVSQTLRLLQQQGCRMAEPGEFTQRAYLNGRMDLSQAEAVADLIASANAASHRLAMNQMRGGISTRLAEMRGQLLTLTSLLELELDFSDHEEVEFADRTQLTDLTRELLDHIARLTDSFRAGNAIKNGIPVAIIGAPNVGKSTLLNALLQEDRAIVSDIQGTTRDVIEDTIVIGAHTFRFIDTAGIRHTDDTIERLGIERSLQAARRAQIIILLTEPGIPFPHIEVDDGQTLIRITNKTDNFQALHAIGLEALKDQLLSKAEQLTATDSDVIVTNARHHAALTAAHQSLQRVATALRQDLPGDLIAQDLREALHHLADITGDQITPDEVLGNIFSHFCIGK